MEIEGPLVNDEECVVYEMAKAVNEQQRYMC